MDVEEEGQLPPPPPDSDAVGPARPPADYDAAAAYAAYPEPTEQQWCAALLRCVGRAQHCGCS